MTISRELPDSLEPSGEFAESIHSFRAAMRHVSQPEATSDTGTWLAPARQRRRAAQRRTVLTTVAGMALLFGSAIPVALRNSHETPTAQVKVPAQAPDVTTSDTALLEQIDSAVTESVPDSLAPLADLDNWSSESQTENRQ